MFAIGRAAADIFAARTLTAVALVLEGIPGLHAPAHARSAEAPECAGQRIGRTADQSDPACWPEVERARADAPNILLIMTDDVGFGASSTFGGPVPAPTFDRLAQNGLRYNGFNTTAVCSPTRAALLTGRNPHRVGMGYVPNLPTGYPGYTSIIPDSAATVADLLRANGYSTAMFGKSHLTPEWEMTRAGPFDRWPTGLGFDYFYGFLSADVSQFDPFLTENTVMVPRPEGDDYHLDKDLADHAIAWISDQKAAAPDKPFFAYYATGTAHAPHHAPKEWLARFRGQFDEGWDAIRQQIFQRQKALGVIPANTELTPRPDIMPSWGSLSPEQRRLYARMMEAHAASLAYADAQIGRIIDHLERTGERDNTLVIYIQGDNGASAEGGENGFMFEQAFINGFREPLEYMLEHLDLIGGPDAYSNFPAAWAWSLNSPFQWTKTVASHLGGVRNGMVVSWPEGIEDKGGLRDQFHFVTDIAPTLYEVAGVTPPVKFAGVQQLSIDGISMAYTFQNSSVPSRRTEQVLEMKENLAIFKDGWWAGTTPASLPGQQFGPNEISARRWELYNLQNDFSQAQDLSGNEPERLRRMQALFWQRASENTILPIHSANEGAEGRPQVTPNRSVYRYTSGITRLVEAAAPPTMGKSFNITAAFNSGDAPAHGVLVTHGGRFGGYALYLKDGIPIFHYNSVGPRQYRIAGERAVGPGAHVVRAKFRIDEARKGAGGWLTLDVDGTEVARGRIDRTLSGWISHTEGFDIGRDTVTPINDDYPVAGSRFNGTLDEIVIALDGECADACTSDSRPE